MGSSDERRSDNVEQPMLGLATTEELLTEVAVRMEVTQSAAEVAGAVMVGIGNWRSFTVEKRYYEVRP